MFFAMNQRPRVGTVKEILTDSQHTVLVHLWKPSTKARSLASAKYRPSYRDNEEEILQVHPMHVVKTGVAFDDEGYLNSVGRAAMRAATKRLKDDV